MNLGCSTRASRKVYRAGTIRVVWWPRPSGTKANFPRVGFVVTNMTDWSRKVAKFQNGRGPPEPWIKEGRNSVKWTQMSCREFKGNQARLHLFAVAHILGSLLRRLALPESVKLWSLTTLREKLIKIGAKVLRHPK